jgi:two-component system, LytTR family, sensor kinase
MSMTVPAGAQPRVSFRSVLASATALWACYFLLATIRAELLDLGFAPELLGRRVLVTFGAVGMTLVLWLVLRQFDSKALWVKVLAAVVTALPVSLGLAQLNQIAFADMEVKIIERYAEKQGVQVRRDESGNLLVDVPLPGLPAIPQQVEPGPDGRPSTHGPYVLNNDKNGYGSVQQLSELALGRYFMLLAWCALYLAMVAGEQARAAERREGEFRQAARIAELRSLRYQVNPHFLFNALNSLSALVLTGKIQLAEEMIQTISTFYRRSLADDPTADVPLSAEFELQKLYLDIESVRFPERLRVVYDLPDDLASARVPGMILQPLVENTVKHAVAPSSGKVTLTIAARLEYGRLVLIVSDDGNASGIMSEALRRDSHGIGLTNVRQRLAARFGDDASIASGKTDCGFATQIRIPLNTHG